MQKVFSFVLMILLLFASLSVPSQSRRPPVKPGPVSARFIVQATLDESDKFVGADTKGDSTLHLEVQASRWIIIQDGDGGTVEFKDLSGGEPPAASGKIALNAVTEYHKGTESAHQTENSRGSVNASDVTLEAPYFSELGDGIAFRISIKSKMAGNCEGVNTGESGTHTTKNCDEVTAGAVTTGFTHSGANPDPGKTPETAFLANFDADLTVGPPITNPEALASLKVSGLQVWIPGNWNGASTHGNKQSGYKITFSGTNDLPGSNGSTQKLTQTLTVTADIIPGAKADLRQTGMVWPDYAVDLGPRLREAYLDGMLDQIDRESDFR
jgi:hypothetical protein